MPAQTFPDVLDSFSTKSTGGTIMASDINLLQTAVEALEAKVGADSSSITTSHDYIISTTLLNIGDDADGDSYATWSTTTDDQFVVNIQGVDKVHIGPDRIYFGAHFLPHTTESYDIGPEGIYFGDAHFYYADINEFLDPNLTGKDNDCFASVGTLNNISDSTYVSMHSGRGESGNNMGVTTIRITDGGVSSIDVDLLSILNGHEANFDDLGKGETKDDVIGNGYTANLSASGATLSLDLGTEVQGVLIAYAEKWTGKFYPNANDFIGMSFGTASGNIELYFWDDATQTDITSEVSTFNNVTYRIIYFYY